MHRKLRTLALQLVVAAFALIPSSILSDQPAPWLGVKLAFAPGSPSASVDIKINCYAIESFSRGMLYMLASHDSGATADSTLLWQGDWAADTAFNRNFLQSIKVGKGKKGVVTAVFQCQFAGESNARVAADLCFVLHLADTVLVDRVTYDGLEDREIQYRLKQAGVDNLTDDQLRIINPKLWKKVIQRRGGTVGDNGDSTSLVSTEHTSAPGLRRASRRESTLITEAIARYYAAFGAGDSQRYRTLLTNDYVLLETGELLDVEGDVALMPTPDGGYQRTDVFDFRSVRIRDDIAYAVYFLKSEIKDRKGSRNRKWLESAILVKSASIWRIALLHSTRIAESGG